MAGHRLQSAPGNTRWVDFDKLINRLKALYSHWNDNKVDLWASADALVMVTPPPSQEPESSISSAFSIWLFGYEIPRIVMVFMKKQIHLLCSPKKSRLLEVLRKAAKCSVSAQLVIHVRKKENGDNDEGSGIMNSIFPAIHDDRSLFVVGEGVRVSEKWREKLRGEGFQIADVSAGLIDLFAVKEEGELVCVRRAASLSASCMKGIVVPKLQNAIDHKEKKEGVRTIILEIEKAILPVPTKVGLIFKYENVDVCCRPDFQSYCSNDELTYYDSATVFTCSIGSRYEGYWSNVARSFLVDPNPYQIRAYEILLKAHEAAITSLSPGRRFSAAYVAAYNLINSEAPEWITHFTKSAGSGIGLEISESGLDLIGTNDRLVKAGMVFNVSLCLQNLKGTDQKDFSLLLADTVVVGAEKTVVLTQASPKVAQDVFLSLHEDEVHDNVGGVGEEEKREPLIMSERREHQAEVSALEKNEETAGRASTRGRSSHKSSDLGEDSAGKAAPVEKVLLLDRPMRLSGLRISHPVFGGRGRTLPGALEAHRNCFRYSNPWPDAVDDGGDDNDHDADCVEVDDDDLFAEMGFSSSIYDDDDCVEVDEDDGDDDDDEGGVDDIMFENIKYALYCHESSTEACVRLIMHFCLKKHIMVGNKKIKDVQFYAEFIDEDKFCSGETTSEVDDLHKRKEGGGKVPGSVAVCRKWRKFMSYVERNRMGPKFLEPNLSFGFHGVLPDCNSVLFFMPIGRHLVQMTVLPFQVIEVDDIEAVEIERIVLGEEQQNDVDMVIVFKDPTKDALRIGSIPSSSHDAMKKWLRRTPIKLKLSGHEKEETVDGDSKSGREWLKWPWLEKETPEESEIEPRNNFGERDQTVEDSMLELLLAEAAGRSYPARPMKRAKDSGKAQGSSPWKRMKGEAQASSPASSESE